MRTNIEAKIVRSFAEVRKDIFELHEEIKNLKREFSKLNKSRRKNEST